MFRVFLAQVCVFSTGMALKKEITTMSGYNETSKLTGS